MSVVDATPVLNNSGYNSVISTKSGYFYYPEEMFTGYFLYPTVSAELYRTKIKYDFTTNKFISELQIPMVIGSTWYTTGACILPDSTNLIASLPVDEYGQKEYERITAAGYYVDGQFYGLGYFGFTSTPTTNPKYFIYLIGYNDTYVSSLSGVKNLTVSYSASVFDNVTWSRTETRAGGICYDVDSSSSGIGIYGNITIDGVVYQNKFTDSGTSTDLIYLSNYSMWTNYWEYWKDAAAGSQWINVWRNNSDTRVLLKRNNSVIYDQRNTTNIFNYGFVNTNSLLANFQNIATGSWYNFTLEGGAAPAASGTVEFSKEIYLPNEDINISYSLTTPDFNTKSYYLKFFNPSNQQLQTFQITNATGSWTPTFNKNVLGNYSVWLGYQYLGCGFSCYDTFLDEDYANYGNQPTSISGNISTNKNTYNVSETMLIYYNTTTAGQISIKNMDGFVSARNLISYVGTNKTTTYVFQPDTGTGGDPLGNYILTLEYKNYQGNWITLGSKNVNLVSPIAIIEFLLPSYYQGDNAEFYFYAKEAGNVTVYDPAGNVKYFRDIPAGDINTRIDDNFYIKPADPTGTWIAKLYNATDVADQATIVVKKKGPVITPTITGTLPPTPAGTVDYLGNATNKKQKENEILNSLYSTITELLLLSILATMVFFLKKMKW